MAANAYVWGVDIGTCSLKALRCRVGDRDGPLEAEAFEYIEYPQMLSQPDADRVGLIREALVEFTSRHDIHEDRLAVSVSGQSGLTKFIKLPPIEAKKIADIVKYEANQQIPFPLDQVVWDWQRLPGGIEEGGFVLEAEVALFAMKRIDVMKALEPLTEGKVDVDILQLPPVALMNMVIFDQLPDPSTLDPDNPPPFTVLVSTGVDTTDLVVTNGLHIWQRNIPIGGNNFTKAIISGLKLTHAKAEHTKRNAVRSANAKQVFLAMRPVFNEFAAELQRSLNYFTGTHKTAEISKVLLLGNAVKLRGLTDFVGKQLGLEVSRLDHFGRLEGKSVLSASAYRENRLAFATAYGLAVQAAGRAEMKTSLMPPQILQDRMIEAKKPLTVLSLTFLLVAALLGYAISYFTWSGYVPELYQRAFAAADSARSSSQAAISQVEEAVARRNEALAQQEALLEIGPRRFETLAMMRAVRSLLPSDREGEVPENPADREELHIDRIDCQYFPDLAAWFTAIKPRWEETNPQDQQPDPAAGQPADLAAGQPPDPAAAAIDPAAAADDPSIGPSGPGWVVEIVGHHFHNEEYHKPLEAAEFVRATLIKSLRGEGEPVVVPAGPQAGEEISLQQLGIGYPTIVESSRVRTERVKVPTLATDDREAGSEPEEERTLPLKRYDFTVQFCWQPGLPGATKLPDPADASEAVPGP